MLPFRDFSKQIILAKYVGSGALPPVHDSYIPVKIFVFFNS
jgi:hypothetical protein